MFALLDDQPEVRLSGREVGSGQRPGEGVRVEHQVRFSHDPGGGVRAPQSRPNPRGQLDIEGVEVDVADALEELGGPAGGELGDDS